MRLVVSRFFNESYLLPWWLNHHRDIFDHGVLIDSHSTDDSADICRELVPEWEVVTSAYRDYSVIMADFEMMVHEARFPGAWKIALNTTEFLVTPTLSAIESFAEHHGHVGIWLPGAIMVDTAPNNPPKPGLPLTRQKDCGIWEDGFDFGAAAIPGLQGATRSRLYHRYMIGAYTPGRHGTHLPALDLAQREPASIWWYGFSPWTEEFKARKRQFAESFGQFDRRQLWGVQHYAELDGLDTRWAQLRTASKPLFGSEDFHQLRARV